MPEQERQEFTDAARARLALATAARELSDDARALVSSRHEETSDTARELIERVAGLVAAAEELRRRAVIYARERSLPWEDIGQALRVSRQSAHERFADVVAQWRDALYDPALHRYEWLPDGAYNPGETVPQLQAWLDAHARAEGATPGDVAAGLPRYDAMRRTTEILSRTAWLAERVRAGREVSPQAQADHELRKTVALDAAAAETARLAGTDPQESA